jgi:hypothetical protein
MNTKSEDSAPIASAARQRLATLIATREEISAAIDRAQTALDRLASAQTIDGPIVGALAALDAAESAAMDAWARSGDGVEAPLPDVAARAELNLKLADARAKAESARRAEGGLQAEAARERAKLGPIELAIGEAVAEVLAEEAGDLIADFLESQRATAAKADQILAARDLIGDLARAAPESAARPIFGTLEFFNRRLEATFARKVPQDVAAKNRAAWAALIGQLHSDANAKLEA